MTDDGGVKEEEENNCSGMRECRKVCKGEGWRKKDVCLSVESWRKSRNYIRRINKCDKLATLTH